MRKEKESIQFILERIYKSWNIAAYEYSDNDCLACYVSADAGKEEIIEPGRKRIALFRETCGQKRYPVIFMEKDMVYFLAFLDERDFLYVFGPAAVEPLSFVAMLDYRRKYGIVRQNYQIPLIPPLASLNILSMAYYMITGKQVSEEQLLEQNDVFPKINQYDRITYEYKRTSEEKHRLSYKEEMQWMKSIEEGIVGNRDQSLTPKNIEKLQNIGTLAEDNAFKQMEYMLVASATLASRAAIRGGMSAHDAYSLSDLYFQRISRCTDVMGLLNVYLQLTDDFSRQVKKAKEQRSSDLVEQCKDYIARNLRNKFSLKDMADKIGKSSSYLSRKFSSETGASIQNYILEKRLQAAANMLKFSDVEIGTIAEYLSFSSQSHFGKQFKDKYAMTPMQYRRKNKIIDFDKSQDMEI